MSSSLPVVLHGGAAPGRVDEDRCVAVEVADDPLGVAVRLIAQTGVLVQRAATRTERAGGPHAGTGGLDDPLHSEMDIALPRIHDATGEQPDVVTRRDQRRPSHRQACGQAETGRRHEAGALRCGEQRRSRQQQAMVAECPQSERAATTA